MYLKAAAVVAPRLGRNRHELFGVRDLKRPRSEVHETEQRRVRAEADGEGEHRRGREGFVGCEKAQRVPEIRHAVPGTPYFGTTPGTAANGRPAANGV